MLALAKPIAALRKPWPPSPAKRTTKSVFFNNPPLSALPKSHPAGTLNSKVLNRMINQGKILRDLGVRILLFKPYDLLMPCPCTKEHRPTQAMIVDNRETVRKYSRIGKGVSN